jgi:hypothetical protein
MIYEYAAVTGAAGTEQWARVGVDQWVDARYLKIAPRAAEGVVDYATVQTQTRPLTVRSAPGVDKSAVDALPKGSPVGVLQYASVMTERGEEKWAKIGANRWVSAQYLAVHSAGPRRDAGRDALSGARDLGARGRAPRRARPGKPGSNGGRDPSLFGRRAGPELDGGLCRWKAAWTDPFQSRKP